MWWHGKTSSWTSTILWLFAKNIGWIKNKFWDSSQQNTHFFRSVFFIFTFASWTNRKDLVTHKKKRIINKFVSNHRVYSFSPPYQIRWRYFSIIENYRMETFFFSWLCANKKHNSRNIHIVADFLHIKTFMTISRVLFSECTEYFALTYFVLFSCEIFTATDNLQINN